MAILHGKQGLLCYKKLCQILFVVANAFEIENFVIGINSLLND